MQPSGGTSITFGQVRRSAVLGDLTLSETHHPAGLRLRPHEHAAANLALPLEGRFGETVERTRFQGAPGALLIKPGGARHSNHYDGGEVVGIVIEVPAAAEERLDLGPLFRDLRCRLDPHYLDLGHRLARELGWQGPGQQLLLEGLVFELFAALRRPLPPAERRPRWLDRIRDQVVAAPREGASLEAIAASVGRHPSHVAREFRRHFGQTIGDYARRRKLEEAAAALRDSRRPLAEIALGAGYYDQSHFNNAFRRAFRVTPAEYRHGGALRPAPTDASAVQDG